MASGPKKTVAIIDASALDNGVQAAAAPVIVAPVADAVNEAAKAPSNR